jgi:hypothetical protein
MKPITAHLAGSNTCSAAGISAKGNAPVLKLCRRLLEAGHGPATPLHVYRGATLALTVRSIGEGAQLTVRESTRDGRPRFARLSGDVASPIEVFRGGRVMTRSAVTERIGGVTDVKGRDRMWLAGTRSPLVLAEIATAKAQSVATENDHTKRLFQAHFVSKQFGFITTLSPPRPCHRGGYCRRSRTI